MFLAILDQYGIFYFFEIYYKMAAGHSIAFLAISDRSAILDVRNSLSMAFLAISDPYGS